MSPSTYLNLSESKSKTLYSLGDKAYLQAHDAGVAESGLAKEAATENRAGLKILWPSAFVSSNLTPCTNEKRRQNKVQKSRRQIFQKEDFERFSENLRQVSMNVSWHQLQQLQSVLHQTQTKRFAGKRRTPKYGSLSKAFTDSQITQFFRVIDDDKFRLIFQYQAQLGLRIGEAVRVNVKDINFETREITLKTEKAKVIDTLLIPNQLFKDTLAFIAKHEADIEKALGLYLL